MKFDLEKLQKELFEHKEKIIADFGLRSDLVSPDEMMVCLLETIDHSRGRSAGGRGIGQREILKAAVRSFIGGISVDVSWGQIVSAEASLRVLLSDYDLPTITARLERGFLTSKKVEEILPGNRRAGRARAILDWARRADTLLSDYSSVLCLEERLQSMALDRFQRRLSDIELTLTIAAVIAAPTRESKASLASLGIDPRNIMSHGMGFFRVIDFLLNLGWDGLVPDKKIFEFVNNNLGSHLEKFASRSSSVLSLIEIRDSKLQRMIMPAIIIGEIRPCGKTNFYMGEILRLFIRYCSSSEPNKYITP